MLKVVPVILYELCSWGNGIVAIYELFISNIEPMKRTALYALYFNLKVAQEWISNLMIKLQSFPSWNKENVAQIDNLDFFFGYL